MVRLDTTRQEAMPHNLSRCIDVHVPNVTNVIFLGHVMHDDKTNVRLILVYTQQKCCTPHTFCML